MQYSETKQLMASSSQNRHYHSSNNESRLVLLKAESFFKKDFIYFFLDRGEGREKEEKERNRNVWLPLMYPLLGTWSTTQACALTGNRPHNPLVCRPALNPLVHTSQC